MNSKGFDKIKSKRSEQKEKEFKVRYGKNVEVHIAIENNDIYHVKIKSKKGKDYIITEKMDKGATQYVLVEYDNKIRRYDRYIFAELDVADDIGREEYGNIR